MAEEISVPIRLPTDSSSVSAAKDVVAGLAAGMKALGPAAASGGAQAQAEMRALGAAAQAAQKEVARAQAQQATRESFGNTPARSADEAKARAAAEKAAGSAAVKAIDDDRRKADQDERRRAKERATLEQKHAKDTADIQRAFLKGAADKRAADAKEAQGLAVGALGVLATITAAAAAISGQFIKALVSVQAFREATLGAYAKLLGGAGAADKAFKETIKTADQIGISYQEALRSVNSLLAQGFKADAANELVKAMADLKSVNPAANVESIVNAIGKIKATGKLQGDELNMLNEAGLSTSLVYEQLAKQLGKTIPEIQAMQRAGKLGADETIKAILAGIAKTTGQPIGKAAEEASKSLGGLLSRLEQIPQGLLLMADASKGVGVLKDVLGNVLKAFSPSTDSGKALAASIGRLGDAFATFLSGLTGADGAKTLEDFARSMATAADKAADLVKSIGELSGPALSEFMKGFSEASKALDGDKAKANAPGYSELGKALGSVAKSLGMLTALSADVNLLGGGLGQLLGLAGQSKSVSVGIGDLLVAALGPLALLDDFSVIGSKISALWDQLMGAISGASERVKLAAMAIGGSLVQGIIAGIGGASPMLSAAVQGLAALATGTMQGAVKTHSPSKLWRDDIGYQLPAGAAEGMYDGAPLMATAAKDVGGMTTRSGASAASSAGGAMVSGGAGRVYNFAAGAIVIQVADGNPRSIAAQFQTALEEIT